MVRTCYVCKINSARQESLDLSFHRLPADPVRRGIWFSLLGIESPTKLPKVTLICSKHFDIKYVKYDLAGKRHLKDGADPLDSCSLEYEQGYASSDSTASPSKEIEAFSPSSETRSGVGSPVRKWLRFDEAPFLPGPPVVLPSLPMVVDETSSTATASEVDEKITFIEKTTHPQAGHKEEKRQGKKRESRYVGDMSLDCCSPVRAKKPV